jgi:large subunit ribosomal protein L9
MEVILLEKLPNLGALGDVVKVKAGFARNYLIPQGKARRATPENLAQFEVRRSELEKLESEALLQAQERGTKLDGLTLQITRKAGVDGKLFGSVTNADISEALAAAGHEVPKAVVRMDSSRIANRSRHVFRVPVLGYWNPPKQIDPSAQ